MKQSPNLQSQHIEKSIAFKALQSDEAKQLDEDFAFLTKRFGKFLKNNKARTGTVWGNHKPDGDSSAPRCFRCNAIGHMKAECPLMKNEKQKGKEVAQPARSFQRGMLATFGAEDANELSSSDDEFPNGTCFMAIEDSQVQPSPSVLNDDMTFDDDKFDDVYDAYAHLVTVFNNACSKVSVLMKEKEKLEEDNEQLKDEAFSEKRRAEELFIKRKELQTIIENFDTTTMQTINDELLEAQTKNTSLEKLKMQLALQLTEKTSLVASRNSDLLEANETISSLKLEFARSISFKETDLRLLREKNKILGRKYAKLESDLSNLKGKQKVGEPTVGVSPRHELDAQMSSRIDVLEKENARLTTLVKSFTNSQTNMDQMLNSLGSHKNRQGLGFGKTNVQTRNPKRLFKSVFHKEPKHYHDQFYYDMCFYNEVYTKKTCHHCNVVGHLSFDCLARYYPKSYFWRVKAKTNMHGINDGLPNVASSFVGAASSSK